MKLLVPLAFIVSMAAAPVFAECVAPFNNIKIPNGDKATMEEMIAANYAIQENTTEVDQYFRCLKAEQAAKIEAIGPDITDEQKAKIASEYVNRQRAETEKLQALADHYDAAERSFRARQATQTSTEETAEQAAAVHAAEQDAAEKARQEASAQRSNQRAEKPPEPGATSR